MKLAAWVGLIVASMVVLSGCVSSETAAAKAEKAKRIAADKGAALKDVKYWVYDSLGQKVPAVGELEKPINVTEFLLNRRGGEPNIGVTASGAVFETAYMYTMKSVDHGKTWTEVLNVSAKIPQDCGPVPAPGSCPLTSYTRSSDPMLWVDPLTSRIFTDHMTSTLCSNMLISDDEGANWIMKPMTCGTPNNDHQKVATAPYHAPMMKPPAPAYPDVVYYCYNKGAVGTWCAVSYNGGLEFQHDQPVTVPARDGCGGINGHPAPAPDGTVYVPMNGPFGTCNGPFVAVTEDNGITWTVRKGPTKFGAEEIDPDITVTPDGTAYMLWRGKDHLQYLARTHDKFVTWEGPWKVSPPDVLSTSYAGITSGDNGRIAMAYLGNRDTSEEPSKAPNGTKWHLFVTYALNANDKEPTFATTQVTSDSDPVQIGCIWLKGGGNPCRNMLDFIDMTSDKDGRIYVAFTDGCTTTTRAGPCANNVTAKDTNSRSRDGAVAVVQDGPSLWAAKPRIEASVKA